MEETPFSGGAIRTQPAECAGFGVGWGEAVLQAEELVQREALRSVDGMSGV